MWNSAIKICEGFLVFWRFIYTMFLGLGDSKLEEWWNEGSCYLHNCLFSSVSWWEEFLNMILYVFGTSKNHQHVKREAFLALIVHRLLCFGACYLLQFNFLVTAVWPIFCLIFWTISVAFKLSKRKTDDNLQILHTILYGKKAKVINQYSFLVYLFWLDIH